MAIITANLSMTEPAYGDSGWNNTINANFTILDAAVNPWFYGSGAPGVIAGQTNNSFYLDTAASNLYKRVANVWTLIASLGTGTGSGGGGSLPSGLPNLVLATAASGSASATASLRALVLADLPYGGAPYLAGLSYAANATVAITEQYGEITATCTLTLPVITAGIDGRVFYFINVSSTGVGTLAAGTGNTINGYPNAVLSNQWQYIVVRANYTAAAWRVIGSN